MTHTRGAAVLLDRYEGRSIYLFGRPYVWHRINGQWRLHAEPPEITAARDNLLAVVEQLATQTPGVGVEGEAHADAGHQPDWLLEEMNRQARAGIANVDNVGDPDALGAYGLEWDRCACGRNIPGDVEQCDECAPCPTCRGAGGWQQHDGLIVECPRGCMTRDNTTPIGQDR